MPHLSKRKLNNNILLKITKRFIQTAVRLKDKTQAEEFFSDLFTKTEQIMFAKRLALIFMICEGDTFDHMGEVLKMSPSTIARISRDVEKGKYAHITFLANRRREHSFLEDYVRVLAGFRIHPYASGRERWKWLNENNAW